MYSHNNEKYSTHYKHHRSENGKVTREYRAYRDMLNRCYYEKHNRYPRYGGRGITVCERWLESFDNFVDDMGACPDGYQLDRKDNDAGYSKGNCRWATRSEQCLNRSSTRKIAHNGETLSISEWAKRTGISEGTLERRINASKMAIDEALSVPVGCTKRQVETVLSFNGQNKALIQWAKEFGLSAQAVRKRIARGWSVESALTTPSQRNLEFTGDN